MIKEETLLIQGVSFKVDTRKSESCLYVSVGDDKNLEISLEVLCKSGIVLLSDGEEKPLKERVSPSLSINEHATVAKTVQELVGLSFKVDTLEEAEEREDTFYFFEHEPFVKYKLDILAIEKKKVHITCEGIAVTDGYAEPYESDEFKLDCWIYIDSDVDD